MKKQILIMMLISFTLAGFSQTAKDLFNVSDVKISWLGIDFSHVKLIGDFSDFAGAGEKSTVQIRDKYFPQWNHLILSESNKYDLRGMLRKGDLFYDIGMIMDLNARTSIENMETYNVPDYRKEDIEGFVKGYDLNGKEGIGVLFVAECLNKNFTEAYFHFVAINMHTKEVLVHERLRGVPRGFGLRNYWAGAVYNIIKDIRNTHYQTWKRQYTQ